MRGTAVGPNQLKRIRVATGLHMVPIRSGEAAQNCCGFELDYVESRWSGVLRIPLNLLRVLCSVAVHVKVFEGSFIHELEPTSIPVGATIAALVNQSRPVGPHRVLKSQVPGILAPGVSDLRKSRPQPALLPAGCLESP